MDKINYCFFRLICSKLMCTSVHSGHMPKVFLIPPFMQHILASRQPHLQTPHIIGIIIRNENGPGNEAITPLSSRLLGVVMRMTECG